MPSSWTYANFESQATNEARLERLRLHIDEVEAAVDANTGGDGFNLDSSSLNAKLERLHARRRELESELDASGGEAGGMSFFRRE